MDGLRQVKVDNWAAFFLQKLQALYTRGDFTDLTLQFHTNECIKVSKLHDLLVLFILLTLLKALSKLLLPLQVHRLVLNTCTEYFETLIKQNNVTDHMRLPPTFQSDVVVPIIKCVTVNFVLYKNPLYSVLF